MTQRLTIALLLALLFGFAGKAEAGCNLKPTITLSPDSVQAAPGTTVTFTVSLTNNDSPSCAPQDMLISTGAGGGSYPYPELYPYPGAIGFVSPGQTYTRTLSATVPSNAPVGIFFNDTVAGQRGNCSGPACVATDFSLIEVVAASSGIFLDDETRDGMCHALGCDYQP